MSKKYEEILRYLINEDHEKATELLHSVIVVRSRSIYADLVNEAEEDEFGGDMGDDFNSDIEADEADIETDELSDGEVEADFGDDEESTDDVEDRVEDLEDQLAELKAEFERLMQDEMEEPYHDAEDFEGDYSGEESDEESDEESEEGELKESTKFSQEVKVSMEKEGQLTGTGKGSEKGSVNTKSTFLNKPSIQSNGAEATDFAGGDEKGEKAAQGQKHGKYSTTATPKSVSVADQTGEGKYVGTGKNSKMGKGHTHSPLSKKPQ